MLVPHCILRRGLTSALCLASFAPASAFQHFSTSSPPPVSTVRMLSTSSSTSGHGGGTFCYRYPRPSVTVDNLIFCLEEEQVKLLLIRRKNDPFKNHWALPGGFVDKDEGLDAAAARELKEETALENLAFAQVGSYGDPGRDPRGHTVTVAYAAVILSSSSRGVKAGDDASDARFFPFGALPTALAFDHRKIVEETWARLIVTKSGNHQVLVERGSGKVLCTLPTPQMAEVVEKSRPFSSL